MDKRFISLFTLLLLMTAFCQPALAAGPAPQFKVNYYFDKPSYLPSDTFLGIMYAENTTTRTASNIRIKISLVGEVLENGTPATKEIYKENLYQPLFSPGPKKFEFTQKISGLNLTEGVYPLKINVTQGKKEIVSYVTYLVVVNQSEGIYPTALVYNRREPVFYDFDRVFLSDAVPVLCRDEANNPGELLAFSQLLTKRNVILNLNLSPSLLEQVKMVSGGFKLKEGDTLKKFESTTPEVRGAVKILSNLKNLLGIKKIELLDSPFSSPLLPALFSRGWEDDVPAQMKLARAAVKKALNPVEPASGFVPTDYELDGNSYMYLRDNYKLLLIKEEKAGKPFKDEDCLVYPVDTEATRFIRENESPEAAAQGLIALLAQDYLNKPRGQYDAKLVDISGLDLGRIDVLMQYLERTPWLKSVPLSSLLKKNYFPGIVKPAAPKESTVATAYYLKFKGTRDFLDFFSKTAVNNALTSDLNTKLLLAESAEWVRMGENEDNIGQYYLSEIETMIRKLFGKIQIVPQEITLSSRSGVIPVAIRNTAGFPFKIIVNLSGSNFTFPEGNSKQVVLNPKENVISFKISSNETGSYKLNVNVASLTGEPVSSGFMTIKSSNLQTLITWLTLIIILAVLLSLIRYKMKKRRVTEDSNGN